VLQFFLYGSPPSRLSKTGLSRQDTGDSGPCYAPALVNARAAAEILRYGCSGDVLYLQRFQRRRIHLEPAKVIGEK
jgi:hypothetical protein